MLSGDRTFLIDELAATAWIGSVVRLPVDERGLASGDVRSLIEGFLPEALQRSSRTRAKIEWDWFSHDNDHPLENIAFLSSKSTIQLKLTYQF